MLLTEQPPAGGALPPLVERESALDALRARLRAAAARAGSVCLVAGEAGIGKTSLLRHFAAEHGASARWLWGMCDPLSTPRTLGPLHDVARQTGGVVAERFFANAPRESLFSSLLDALDAGSRPTVLIIEDVHWADEATLDLVLFLGRRIAARPVLLVVSFRDDEAASDTLFHATLGALPSGLIERITLERLSERAVGELATRAQRPADNLYAATGGNPFFVSEMLQAWPEPGVPATIRHAVIARTRRLSPGARETLDLIAVVPGSVELDLLERGLGVDPLAVQEGVDAGLLVATAQAAAFRHDLARRAVESAIGTIARRRLHARVLAALVEIHEAAGRIELARLVHHAREACDADAVLRFAPAAAKEAAGASAHREALRHYEAALVYAERLPAPERAELLEGSSSEAYLNGRATDALQPRRDALAIWTGIGRRDRAGATLRCLARLHWWAGQPDDARRAAEEAIRLLEMLEPGHELAMAYSTMSQLHMLALREQDAIRWGERAAELARRLGDVEALAHALTNVASARMRRGDEMAAATLDGAFELARSAGLDDHAARALLNCASNLLDSRRYDAAQTAIARAVDYSSAHALDAYTHYLLGQRARLHLERGSWALAERDARAVLAQCEYPGVAPIPATVVLGTLMLRRGDAGASGMLESARARAYPTRELHRTGRVAAALAEHAWLANDPATAIAEAEPALELAVRVGHEWLIGELARRLARVGRHTNVAAKAAEPFRLELSGDWAGAADAWQALGCPYERAEALSKGPAEAALEALSIFDTYGARRRAEHLRRELRARGVRVPVGPRRATRANRAGLTRRQMDVLHLLAEGYTNQEISARLHLAPKTVDHHVSAILEKLPAATRRAAVRRARELGLLGGEK